MRRTLDETLRILDALQGRGIHYDLEAIRVAAERRKHPERAFKSVIVAGTNGKGSTAAMLYAMLRALGYRAGLYTSPHLVDVCERIRADAWIPRGALARWLALYADEGLLTSLTYYEALTLTAFDWFREQAVEWAVLEVGVGGRLDAVNVAPAEGVIITSIDFDHRDLLGDTIGQIAAEKAGVIKPGKPVIAALLPAEAQEVIERQVADRQAMLYQEGMAWTIEPSGRGMIYDGRGKAVVTKLPFVGDHQRANTALALAALEHIVGLDIESCGEEIRAGLAMVQWPARFQTLNMRPLIILDGAHNPAGTRALAAAWQQEYPGKMPHIVFAAFADKDHNAMLAVLRQVSDRFWITDIPGQVRALAATSIAADPALAGATVEIVAPDTLLPRMRVAAPNESFLVTGSLAFAGWFLSAWATQ